MADRVRIKKASRISVVISTLFHTILVGGLAFFAAKEGMLGKEMKKIAVTMVAKEKPPEKPKEKPPEPKPEKEPEKAKEDSPPVQRLASLPPPAAANYAPAMESAIAAPAAAEAPAFDFGGGKEVQTTSNPADIYKSYMEYSFRSHWDRPENINDDNFVAEVAVNVASDGSITSTEWEKGSGNTAWDNSVKKALTETDSIGRPPPKGFPSRIVVRFDVLSATAESTIQ